MWGADKREFEAQCGMQWPCADACNQNFSMICPSGWALIGGVCEAVVGDSEYTGPCLPFANLINLSKVEKAVFAGACGVQFCNDDDQPVTAKTCGEEDADRECPEGWRRVGSLAGYCYGDAYEGPCRPVVPIADVRAVGRNAFASMCGVKWPCRSQGAAVPPSTQRQPRPDLSGPVSNGRIYGFHGPP
mmetsp:Transcript_105014/g.313734  ORF Transcript_105014/g.313734 Transcript_105014/m.313734 type:complete len:188 (+) Transcript_105014:552-1115(+)